ncbi:MAG TPA: GDSL-type esterase/lipase family protein [Opitutaceae bacterium]
MNPRVTRPLTFRRRALGAALCFSATWSLTAVELAPVFTDHMVLQAHRAVPVWGTGTPGENVTVEFAGQRQTTTADTAGRWRVTLAPMKYAPDHAAQVLVARGNDEQRITDVLIGEVWLCAGASTMLQRPGGPSVPPLLGDGASPAREGFIRLLNVSTDVEGERPADRTWRIDSPETAGRFSALGHFFGSELHATAGAPIGLIELGRSRASVLSFLPWSDVANDPAVRDGLPSPATKHYEERERVYRNDVGWLAPFSVRGVLWAQGEEDVPYAAHYPRWFASMIRRWRADFERLDLPFLVVQSPGLRRGDNGPNESASADAVCKFREAQGRTAGEVPGVGLVVSVDLGTRFEADPKRMRELGARLAKAARGRVYGELVPGDRAPTRGEIKREPGRLLIEFNGADGGLVVQGATLRNFELVDAAGRIVPAEAELADARHVAVRIPYAFEVAGVRYGWADVFEATLRNAYGQPAAPFRAEIGRPPETAGPERWARLIEVFTQQDQLRAPPSDGVVFIGSSTIRGWLTLADDFPGHPVVNRGFGGSQASDSVHYFDAIVRPYRPRTIVFYAGENDLAMGREPTEVAASFAAFCEKTHAALPSTRIVFLAVKPSPRRWALQAQCAETNALVARYCAADTRRRFVDVATLLLDADGQPRRELFVDDGLHMNASGYHLWVRTLSPLLE